MNDAGFVIGSYVITLAAIAGYIAAIVRKARRLGRRVGREHRPWT